MSIYLSIHPFRVLISAVSTKVTPPALHFFNNCFDNKFTNGTNIIYPFIKICIHCSVPYIHLSKYPSINHTHKLLFTLLELVWKVARYTSAGPTYFSECDNYVDGGVLANNPCMAAWAEINEHFEVMVC